MTSILDFERLQSEPDQYVAELSKTLDSNPSDLNAIQVLAEAKFELGDAEEALPLVEQAMKLDPEGNQGAAKFFWAGQLYGGRKGLDFYMKGVIALQRDLNQSKNSAPAVRETIGIQLSQAYLGMIEIWMTDLCMEPEAETQCERLITEAFLTSESDPEAWSVLGSIRISQLQTDSAKDALTRAWDLFGQAIENQTVDHNVVPKLVRLAQSMMELRMLELVLEVTGELHRLDDQVPDLYYLNALCHQVLADEATTPTERSKHIVAARDAAALLEELEEDVDPELLDAARQIVQSLPDPEIANPYDEEDKTMTLEGE